MTCDTVVAVSHGFESARFRRTGPLIHDYVSGDGGMVSLLERAGEAGAEIVTHGPGPHQGLTDLLEPIDRLSASLPEGISLKKEGVCDN